MIESRGLNVANHLLKFSKKGRCNPFANSFVGRNLRVCMCEKVCDFEGNLGSLGVGGPSWCTRGSRLLIEGKMWVGVRPPITITQSWCTSKRVCRMHHSQTSCYYIDNFPSLLIRIVWIWLDGRRNLRIWAVIWFVIGFWVSNVCDK